jgi:hypothetical protein
MLKCRKYLQDTLVVLYICIIKINTQINLNFYKE